MLFFYNLPEVLIHYRLHGKQTSQEFSKPQLNSSSQLRLMMINNMGIQPTAEEMATHEAISRGCATKLEDAKLWLEKLYDKNLESNHFDYISFDAVLRERWWQVLNVNTVYGVSTFLFYLKSKSLHYKDKSKINTFKFLIKCVIRYQSKRVSG